MTDRIECNCESSLCDHDGRCDRPVDPRLRMAYVGETCLPCAANMAATGGGDYLSLEPAYAKAEELRAEARAADESAAESFERSDTDGFVSQWASGISARKARLEADIVEAGGIATFGIYQLQDLDGDPVEAKLIRGKFGPCWALLGEDDQFSGEFVTAHPVRESTMTKKGYREVVLEFVAPAKAKIHASGRGLSGAASATVIVAPKDGRVKFDRVVGLGDIADEEVRIELT